MAQPYSPYAPLQSHRSPEAREARRDYFGDTVGKKLIDSYLQPIGSFDGEMLARSEVPREMRSRVAYWASESADTEVGRSVCFKPLKRHSCRSLSTVPATMRER